MYLNRCVLIAHKGETYLNIISFISCFSQELPSETKINSIKEETIKQEPKIQGNKVTSESIQSNDKKSDMEKTSASNQSSNAASTTVEANGIDNEDSINLTIGEDEENLLVEEVRIQRKGKNK